MRKALKKKWVAALLSGEYKQGRLAMYTNGKYCCLGVLASIHNSGLSDFNNHMRDSYIRDDYGNFRILSENTQRALASVNDSGVPFEMIAGLIDEAL